MGARQSTVLRLKGRLGRSDSAPKEENIIACRAAPVAGRYSCSRSLEHDYRLEAQVVGSGMNGPVRLATGKSDGRQYAVKSFRKTGLAPPRRAELKSEVEIFLSLDHPHVARLEMVFETEDELHLVMEYMAGGELYDRLAERTRYSEQDAAGTSHQMLLAVAYLHAHQVVHRDLKLENFLYERRDRDHLKLIDFGFAKFWDRSQKMSQACGSIHYVAPEVLAHSYTDKADMWSVGVIVYMLLVGSPPFRGVDRDLLRTIKEGVPQYSTRFHKLSAPARGFVQSLLKKDPTERLDAATALEHPWLNGRHQAGGSVIDATILQSLRDFARASNFRRAVLSMMAWSLSAEDREKLREQFLLLDTERRGTITHQELRRVLEENFHVDGAEAETLITSLDVDHDHEIEYSEFLAAALVSRVEVHEAVLRKTFSRFDRDGDGRIDCEEFRSVLGDDFDDADVEELIRKADTTGDRKIDYDEFIAYFLKPERSDMGFAGGEPSTPVRNARRRRTEHMSVVIDRLVASEDGPDLETASDHGGCAAGLSPQRKRIVTRSKTVPEGLPTLLRNIRSSAEHKL